MITVSKNLFTLKIDLNLTIPYILPEEPAMAGSLI